MQLGGQGLNLVFPPLDFKIFFDRAFAALVHDSLYTHFWQNGIATRCLNYRVYCFLVVPQFTLAVSTITRTVALLPEPLKHSYIQWILLLGTVY